VSTPPPPSDAPTIGGKPLFSSLRENAPLADMIEEVERAVLTSARSVTWDDVVGLEAAKRSLEETMVLPLVAQVLRHGGVCGGHCVCLDADPRDVFV
jgi:SpoVK/Ycf46/Vps4 family AAA+-type ATPase